MNVLWIVGEPGVGKTSIVRSMVEGLPMPRLFEKPKWTAWGNKVVAAGHYTGATFDGADTVPYNGVKQALDFWREMLASKIELTILDGDRFSSASAKKFFEDAGVTLACVHVESSLAAARRAQRGSNQNESWVKGRITKARNFALGFDLCLWLKSDIPPKSLAEGVWGWINTLPSRGAGARLSVPSDLSSMPPPS